IHRDLKPSNIHILPKGRVKVVDFGLGKAFSSVDIQGIETITTNGFSFGTPKYMSPEQANHQPLDQRSDIYSLGVLFYQMLVGETPFVDKTPLALIEAHAKKQPPLPHQINPNVKLPTVLELLILRMLRKEPHRRPQSVNEVAEQLRSTIETEKLYSAEVDLANVVHGAAPQDDPQKELNISLPLRGDKNEKEILRVLLVEQRQQVIERILEMQTNTVPHYFSINSDRRRAGLGIWLDAIGANIGPDRPTTLSEAVEKILDERSEQLFPAHEVLAAFWAGYWALRPILQEAAGSDLNRFISLQHCLEEAAVPLYLQVAERYAATLNTKLMRQAELLAQQNEELRELRDQLDTQLRHAHVDLVHSEQLKSRIFDTISDGVLLVEHNTWKILVFNKAMEQLTSLDAKEVIGRSIDELAHLAKGIPFAEFAEQMRFRHEVGARKLKVSFPSGSEHTIYVHGQALLDTKGQQTASIYVLEDITEWERIIERFSRHVPPEIAKKILSGH
ncbi:MAG: protein kinase, partial [Pseudomonadota bacterium]